MYFYIISYNVNNVISDTAGADQIFNRIIANCGGKKNLHNEKFK
jgi:hypothetical protein